MFDSTEASSIFPFFFLVASETALFCSVIGPFTKKHTEIQRDQSQVIHPHQSKRAFTASNDAQCFVRPYVLHYYSRFEMCPAKLPPLGTACLDATCQVHNWTKRAGTCLLTNWSLQHMLCLMVGCCSL